MSTVPKSAVRHLPVGADTLDDPAATYAAWQRYLDRVGLADESKRTYAREVRAFTTWLAEQGKHRPAEAFSDPHTRDYAVRDYRRMLLAEQKRAPKGVSTAMTAINNLYGWLGLGAADVPRMPRPPRTAPKALEQDPTRDLLRAAERRGNRDRAIVATFLSTGLRIAELTALDLDDVWLTDRKGEVTVRAGKGDRPRSVPLNAQGRDAMRAWLAERASWPAASTCPAVFLSNRGRRMADRTIRYAVYQAAKGAGISTKPHELRHTFATALIRNGVDVATLADLLGHSDLNTTRIYTHPTRDDLDAAVEHATVDY